MKNISTCVILLYIYLIYMTLLIDCKPTTTTSSPGPTRKIKQHMKLQNVSGEVIDHLVKYGYLSETTEKQRETSPYSEKELEDALKDYQAFMTLPVTGVVDEKTLKNMNKSRCGVKDKTPDLRVKVTLTTRGRRKRRRITNFQTPTTFWYLVSPDHKLRAVKNVYHQLEYAFNMWAGVSNLVFIRGDNKKYSDILIGFYTGPHGDSENFDGKGNIIAHASASVREIHFDEEEDWESNKNNDLFRWLHPGKGTDFIQCAMHEIGHVLGLDHVNNKKSVMFPTLENFSFGTEYALGDMDILRIKASYGRCEPSRFDAIFTNKYRDGKTYIIIGPYVYRFNDQNRVVDQTYPKVTSTEFNGARFPDEVFWNSDYFLYWFIGDEYYFFSTSQYYPSQRRKIGKSPNSGEIGWPGLQEPKVDAAVTIANGIGEDAYIFRKNLVYKMINDNTNWQKYQLPHQKVAPGWPKKISEAFPGIPDDLDTAFTWGFDGNVYFFKGRYFQIWHPNDVGKTKVRYDIHQWKNACDVYKCQIGPIDNYYKCDSWAFTRTDCGHSCAPRDD